MIRPFADFDPIRILAHPGIARAATHADDLEQHQWRHLKRLLLHAHAHVPFFRDAFARAGIDPGAMRSPGDFLELPTFSRRDCQDTPLAHRLDRRLDPARLLDRSTSGSTGERLAVKRTWFEERLLNTFRWRAWREYGLRHTDRLAILYFHRAQDPRDNQLLQRIAARLGLGRQRVFDAVGDPDMARAARDFQPHAIAGMTSAIALLADQWAKEGIHIPLRFVATGGELLTEPLRARISTLGAPILDLYGSNELNLLAWRCPAGADAYHVCDDAHQIEVLRPDNTPAKPGESGEIVATSLFSYAMPFIRYRIGDLAVRGPDRCPCGAPFSTLLSIQGRTIDRFPLGDDTWLHPWEIINAIRPHFGWIRQSQIVQSERRRLTLRIVPLRAPAAAEIDQLTSAAIAAVGKRARISIERTHHIAPSPSGKPIPFVSLPLNPPAD